LTQSIRNVHADVLLFDLHVAGRRLEPQPRPVCHDFVNVPELSPDDLDRLIGMAWEDRTPFEAIEVQFGLKENEVRALMRRHLKPGSFRRWRARV